MCTVRRPKDFKIGQHEAEITYRSKYQRSVVHPVAVFQLTIYLKKETSAFEAFPLSLRGSSSVAKSHVTFPISLFRAMALGLGHGPLARFLSTQFGMYFWIFQAKRYSISIGFKESASA